MPPKVLKVFMHFEFTLIPNEYLILTLGLATVEPLVSVQGSNDQNSKFNTFITSNMHSQLHYNKRLENLC